YPHAESRSSLGVSHTVGGSEGSAIELRRVHRPTGARRQGWQQPRPLQRVQERFSAAHRLRLDASHAEQEVCPSRSLHHLLFHGGNWHQSAIASKSSV